jgi:putative transposase
MLGQTDAHRFDLVVETQKGPSMRFSNSIFASLLKPLDRRRFGARVERLNADAYDKSFRSWDHLAALIYGQLAQVCGLRALVASFNANAHHHYHLGVRSLARATLSDANARRPPEVFAQTFADLAEMAGRRLRGEAAEMVRLIDSSPIPLGELCRWAPWNGRIRGLKLHIVYDPAGDVAHAAQVTPATVNDSEIGRQTKLEAGATYVFDKGYCHFGWWREIHAAQAFFVTRPKRFTRLATIRLRPVNSVAGGLGFRILEDAEVELASKGDSRLAMPLRRIRLRRKDGGIITLLSNDMTRSAAEIGALYKSRWQIELLFRWIKQHLHIRKFLGTSDNAIRLQLFAAMIAYLLLRIAAKLNRIDTMPALRFAELVGQFLFARKPIAKIDKPPPVNPSKRQSNVSANQLELCYG